ncbi:hypothetical protein [Parasitella parasitica]|uniref:Uncharacterized protein n=1 Tax=Parasitella parasitica TaxID=35722 RepID=A0A0B7NQC6_9FUNG|nr:hypothetical protein [Parasitella parasitica]
MSSNKIQNTPDVGPIAMPTWAVAMLDEITALKKTSATLSTLHEQNAKLQSQLDAALDEIKSLKALISSSENTQQQPEKPQAPQQQRKNVSFSDTTTTTTTNNQQWQTVTSKKKQKQQKKQKTLKKLQKQTEAQQPPSENMLDGAF